MITREDVIELFNYNDGKLFHKKSGSGKKIGNRAGYKHSNGYRRVWVNGKKYLEHRVIFLYNHGYLPEFIDHINGIKDNNKIENLRAVTISQNCMNKKSSKNSSSQYKGVYWCNNIKIWKAGIKIDGRQIHLGYFSNEIDAAIAYNDKSKELFGEFALLNEVYK